MILRYFGWKQWFYTAMCVLFVIFQVYLDLRIPEYMGVITDAIMANEDSSVITEYGLEMIGCALLSLIVALLGTMMAVKAATSLCYQIRKDMFNKVSGFTPEDVERFSVDSLITRSTNDVSQVQQFITRAMQTIITVPIITVWALIKISGSQIEWTVATILGVVITISAISLIIWTTRPRYKRIPRLTDHINHYSLEHLTGVRVVRAYGAERFQEKKFEEASDDMRDNSVAIWKISSVTPALSSGVGNFLTLSIYWIGILLISSTEGAESQTVLFSDMIIFSSYAVLILNSFMRFAFLIQFSARAMASEKRVEELLDYTPSIQNGSFSETTMMPGTIELDDVSFSYPGTDVEVLHNISFKINEGETVAIMGATGSGKSTLINIILRFYKASNGNVFVNGVNVNDYDRSTLNSLISYVPQNNTVFTGTIESNVNYGSTSSERDYDDVRVAESIAQATEFIDELEEKESFELKEGGRNLSGGQRQRLSIARAICKNAPIWILDDPFSSLDFGTDSRLRSSIKEKCDYPTKIFVAQRVGTVMNSDKIIVLDEGRIIGIGKHNELMKTCQLYREMAESQMTEGTY